MDFFENHTDKNFYPLIQSKNDIPLGPIIAISWPDLKDPEIDLKIKEEFSEKGAA